VDVCGVAGFGLAAALSDPETFAQVNAAFRLGRPASCHRRTARVASAALAFTVLPANSHAHVRNENRPEVKAPEAKAIPDRSEPGGRNDDCVPIPRQPSLVVRPSGRERISERVSSALRDLMTRALMPTS